MKLAVDLDGTLCTWHPQAHERAEPLPGRIEAVRELVRDGHDLWIYTARGTSLGSVAAAEARWGDLTRRHLAEWGVPYTRLIFGKPSFDLLIDDRAIDFACNWRQEVLDRTPNAGAIVPPATPFAEATP